MTSRAGITTGLILTVCLAVTAAENNDAVLRDRYLASALRNPRHGTAVERLYQLAAETDGIEALVRQIDAMPAGAAAASRFTLVGLLQEMRGRDVEALAAFQRAAAADRKAYYPRYARGLILQHRNEYRPAIKSLRAALQADPPLDDAIEIQKALGRCYLRSRQLEAAKETWSALAKIAPDDPVTLQELTTLLVDEEQWDEALAYYRRLRAVQKDRPYQAVLCTIAMGKVEARRGRFEAALDQYEQALAKTAPDSWLATEVRSRIDDLFRKRNDLTGLVKYYQQRLADKDATDVHAMVQLAELLAELDRADEARKWYAKALALAPKNENVQLAYIHLLEVANDLPAAIAQYQQLLEQNPKQVAYLEALGGLQLEAGGAEARDKARTLWRRIGDLNANDAATMVQVAEIFRAHKMNEDAAGYFKRAIELAPDVGQYREYYGEFLLKTDRRDEALKVFQQMAAGPRRNVDRLLRLADVLGYFAFDAESLAAARGAVALKPNHFEARMQLAKRLAAGDQWDAALAELDHAARLAPNRFFASQVTDTRIRLLDRAGRLQEVFQKQVDALTAKPAADAGPYVQCAKMALALRQNEPAVALVATARRKDTEAVPVLELAARVYQRAGQYQPLAETLHKLIERAPQNRVEYYRQLAQLHARLGASDQAIQAAEEVIRANPDNPSGYTLLATLCQRFGKPDRSLAILKEALKVDPKNVDLRMQYGRRLEQSGQFDAAIEQYWLAYDAQEDLGDKLSVIRTLADACYQSSKFEQLVDRLQRQRRLTRDDWVPALGLATAYRRIEDFAKAREMLTGLLAKRPDETNLLLQLAQLSKAEGLIDEAAKYLERLVKLEPSRRNFMQLAEALFDLEQNDEAIAAWRRAAESSSDTTQALVDAALGLLQRDLADSAIDLLAEVGQRQPENWKVGYLYGMALLDADRAEEADKVFVRIADLADLPAKKDKKKPKGKAQKSQATAQQSYYQQVPPEFARASKIFSLRYQLASQYRGGSQRQKVFVPPDLDTARAAAWYQHCQIARENGTYDQLVEALKKAGTAQSLWRLVQSRAAEQQTSKELYEAVTALTKLKPDDTAAKVLRMQVVMNLAGSQNGNVDVPFDEVRALYDELVKDHPNLAVYVTSSWMYYLKRAGKQDELKAMVEKLASQDFTDYRAAAVAIGMAVQAKELDAAVKLLHRAEDQFAGAMGPAGVSSWSWTYTSLANLAITKKRPELAAEFLVGYLRKTRPATPRMARTYSPYNASYGGHGSGVESFPNVTAYYDANRLRVLDQFYRTASGKGNNRYVLPAPAAASAPSKPAPPSAKADGEQAESDPPALVAVRKRLAADLKSDNEEDRLYSHLALAYLDWWSDRRAGAAEHLAGAIKLRPWDVSLSLALAQLRYQTDDKRGALEALAGIQRRYHPLYKPAQQLTLRIARELGDTATARATALRLFSMQMTSQEQLVLAATLHELGEGTKAVQLERRVKALSRNDLNQLFQLMQQQQGRGAKKEAAELAKQILHHLGKATMNEQYYRESALRTLKDAGQLEPMIAEAEKQLAANPNALRVLVDLWHYTTTKGDHEKARGYAKRAVDLRPGDMRLRYQFATALLRLGKKDEALAHFKAILAKDPNQLIGGSRIYEVIRAFRDAKQLGEFSRLLTEMDWKKLSRGRNVQPNQIVNNLTQIASQLAREENADALPFLDKLNDYVAGDSQMQGSYRRVVGLRVKALLQPRGSGTKEPMAEAVRAWAAFRYILACSTMFDGFTPQPPESLPSDATATPVGVKTQRNDLLTYVYSWNHPYGDPGGVLADLLDVAVKAEQIEDMRRFVDGKNAAGNWDVRTAIWMALLDERLGRLDAVRAAVPEILKRGNQSGLQNQQLSYALMWLDQALARHDELLDQSVACCEFLVQQQSQSRNSGLANLFLRRLADRYFRSKQRDKGRAALMELAAMKLDTGSGYPAQYAREQELRYKMSAAEGLNEAGLVADAYAIASKVAHDKSIPQNRSWIVDQAHRLLKKIADQHPQYGTLVKVLATPVAADAIQVVWTAPHKGLDVGARAGAQVVLVDADPGLFQGCRAEVQVSVSQRGGFRRVAVAPAGPQQYVHRQVPANRLFWYRVVLRDAEDRVVAVSDPVPAATGPNLIEDGPIEQVALGPLATEVTAGGPSLWTATDLAGTPRDGFAVVEDQRPFSTGSRCILGDTGGPEWIVACRPIPADPSKRYLMGAWLRTYKYTAVCARLALDEHKRAITLHEANWVVDDPHWAFVVQRLHAGGAIEVASTPGEPRRHTQAGADRMPETQKYMRVGCMQEGAAALDDAFLIEYANADADELDSLPAAAEAVRDQEAATRFAARMTARAERPELALAAPAASDAAASAEPAADRSAFRRYAEAMRQAQQAAAGGAVEEALDKPVGNALRGVPPSTAGGNVKEAIKKPVGNALRGVPPSTAGGNVKEALEKLAALQPAPGQPDPRGFEWYYLQSSWQGRPRTLSGHGKPVLASAFAPDGTLVATGSADGTVRLWDATAARELAVMTPPWTESAAVAFAPDGTTLAAGGKTKDGAGEIRFWNVRTQKLTSTIHTERVRAIAFSPDGTILAVAAGRTDNNGVVTLWVVATGELRATIAAHEGGVAAVAFSPDGTTLASGGRDATAKIWSVSTGAELTVLEGHEQGVSSLAFSPDGKLLASGGGWNGQASGTCRVKLWNTSSWQEIATFGEHPSPVRALAFSPDSTTLATGDGPKGRPSAVRLWDIATTRVRAVLAGHSDEVRAVAFSADGSTLVTASSDQTARLWDLTAPQYTGPSEPHRLPLRAVAFSPDSRLLATASTDRTVRLWDLGTGRERATLSGHQGAVTYLAFSPQAETLATGSEDRTWKLWDTSTGKERLSASGHAGAVYDVAFSPAGDLVATASADGTAAVWSVAAAELRVRLEGHEGPVRTVAFAPDGATLASGGADGTVRLWDVATGHELAVLAKRDAAVTSVRFSPDGTTLAAASDDKTVTLWDVSAGRPRETQTRARLGNLRQAPDSSTGSEGARQAPDNRTGSREPRRAPAIGVARLRATLTGHEQGVTSLAFFPDGKTLATGSRDKTVKLWDLATQCERATFRAGVGAVRCVAVSPDGAILGAAGASTNVRLWRAR